MYENFVKKDIPDLESRLNELLKREEKFKTTINDEKASLNKMKKIKRFRTSN